jgi:carnitine 3-dehydrogenase
LVRVETFCVEGAGKKMHLFHQMFEGDRIIASGEHMLIHVSLKTRKASVPASHIVAALKKIVEAHALMPRPDGIGRMVGKK